MFKIRSQKSDREDCFIVRVDNHKDNGERLCMIEPLYIKPQNIETSLAKVLREIEKFIN